MTAPAIAPPFPPSDDDDDNDDEDDDELALRHWFLSSSLDFEPSTENKGWPCKLIVSDKVLNLINQLTIAYLETESNQSHNVIFLLIVKNKNITSL